MVLVNDYRLCAKYGIASSSAVNDLETAIDCRKRNQTNTRAITNIDKALEDSDYDSEEDMGDVLPSGKLHGAKTIVKLKLINFKLNFENQFQTFS